MTNDIEAILNRNNELILEGIPAQEIYRVLMAEFSAEPIDVSFWPEDVTGQEVIVDIDGKRPSAIVPYERNHGQSDVGESFAPWNISMDNPFPQNFSPAEDSDVWSGLANANDHLLAAIDSGDPVLAVSNYHSTDSSIYDRLKNIAAKTSCYLWRQRKMG